jgi:hypothetical protein
VKASTDLLRMQQGSPCIYRDRQVICCGQITSLRMTDWGIHFQIESNPQTGVAVGLHLTGREWSVGGMWEHFAWDAYTWSWSKPGLDWILLFDTELIADIQTLAKNFTAIDSETDRFQMLARCIDRHRVS